VIKNSVHVNDLGKGLAFFLRRRRDAAQRPKLQGEAGGARESIMVGSRQLCWNCGKFVCLTRNRETTDRAKKLGD